MAYKIRGIAVYPIEEQEVQKVRCSDNVKIPVKPEKKYHLVCNAEIDEKRPNDFSVEGSIKKTTDALVEDRILDKKTLKEGNKDIEGLYRQWWDWENKYPEWKEEGKYEVTLRLIDRKSASPGNKPAATFTFPVEFKRRGQ